MWTKVLEVWGSVLESESEAGSVVVVVVVMVEGAGAMSLSGYWYFRVLRRGVCGGRRERWIVPSPGESGVVVKGDCMVWVWVWVLEAELVVFWSRASEGFGVLLHGGWRFEIVLGFVLIVSSSTTSCCSNSTS